MAAHPAIRVLSFDSDEVRSKLIASRYSPQHEAVLRIERWWTSIRNKRIFNAIKYAICSSEHSLSNEILRKLSPREAHLLDDPALHTKIKFRLDGTQFPPVVLFKIYSNSHTNQYFSGKTMIRPMSEAAEDARQQMGNRLFYDQLLTDACHHHKFLFTEVTDITTIKDYMKYSASLDETPAYYGGKENYWRKLSLDVLPRHSSMYNVVEFLTSKTHSKSKTSYLCSPSQHQQIELIKSISTLRSSPGQQRSAPIDGSRERRSHLAQRRVEKMRKNYNAETHTGTNSLSPKPDHSLGMEEEAVELYQWTQDLSFDDLN